MARVVPGTPLSPDDLHFFEEGTHRRLFDAFSPRPRPDGAYAFAVWAPNATAVSVVGDMNGWDAAAHQLVPGPSGIWSGGIAGVAPGQRYRYLVRGRDGRVRHKADPFAALAEVPPGTASVVWDPAYDWGDGAWMERRRTHDPAHEPISVYEVHLGSWRRGDAGRMLTYREVADPLAEHALRHGFTHVELMPLSEHPFYGSWGYLPTGYFAPTSRYGSPQDLMSLVDTLHRAGIGVLLDWVPAHFPDDPHGLASFDGTPLYEHRDPRRRRHPEWDSYVFDLDRPQVRSFLISSAIHWLERYHVDGLRVDAVASMLYLDHSRGPAERTPGPGGGGEDVAGIAFLRALNDAVHAEVPGAVTIAEESTAWPMVSRPPDVGGLGFDMKWDMGWMHDTLAYLARDPIQRKHYHHELTFRGMYAFSESYVLPLSHDEVAEGKGSLLGRMAGDEWQQRANLRLLYAYQYAQPGKKLLFMGGELAQRTEWRHDHAVEWQLLARPTHEGVSRLVAHLARTYAGEPALHDLDWDPNGFRWVDADDSEQSVLSFLRTDRSRRRVVLAVLNFTPVPRQGYRVGAPHGGTWKEIVNTDSTEYGGAGYGNFGGADASPFGFHGLPYSLALTLPPLGALYLLHEG